MNNSVDRSTPSNNQPFDDLDRIRDEVLSNINATFQGSMNGSITEEFRKYFNEGLSAYHFNVSIGSSMIGTVTEMDRVCGINATYWILFPPVEQAKIVSLGNNLQQIRVARDVIRNVSINCLLYVCSISLVGIDQENYGSKKMHPKNSLVIITT